MQARLSRRRRMSTVCFASSPGTHQMRPLFFDHQRKSIIGSDMSRQCMLPRTCGESCTEPRPGSVWGSYRWPSFRRDLTMVIYISPCDFFSRILSAYLQYPYRGTFNALTPNIQNAEAPCLQVACYEAADTSTYNVHPPRTSSYVLHKGPTPGSSRTD